MKRYHISQTFLLGIVLGCTGAVSPGSESGAPSATAGQVTVYIGTNTRGPNKGIYLAHLDLASGALESAGCVAEVASPSFLAFHPSRPLLYCVGELSGPERQKAGAVNALAIDPKTGKLNLLNQQSTRGPGPCHLVVDRSGKYVLVANYSGGSAACLPIQDDGRLGEAICFVQHKGAGTHPQRQEGPHAHSINLDPANRFAFVADLGIDKIMVYRFDAARGQLTANDPAWLATAAGAGPRHFSFHPNGRYAYVINELNSTITALGYDAEHGILQPLETVSTLPDGFQGTNTSAEVQVHPSGKFVYGSNRGHNSIAVFAVDDRTGKLRCLGHESTRGKTPRNFAIDPSGNYLLAANQDSNNVVVFRIDAATGGLRPTGSTIEVPAAVCIKMLPLPPISH